MSGYLNTQRIARLTTDEAKVRSCPALAGDLIGRWRQLAGKRVSLLYPPQVQPQSKCGAKHWLVTPHTNIPDGLPQVPAGDTLWLCEHVLDLDEPKPSMLRVWCFCAMLPLYALVGVWKARDTYRPEVKR